MPQKILRIATRKSPLALWQAHHIRDSLLKLFPNLMIELLPMLTSGDQFLASKLSYVSGKNLFVKELEEALFAKRADFAVHSMKDVPIALPQGLCLAAICARGNPFDALISQSKHTLIQLPLGSTIGTISLRRQSQLRALRPDLNIKAIRGNIHTRIAKLKEYDAIVLAAAGLQRMGYDDLIAEIFSSKTMLPACGQGALGVECRDDDSELKQYLHGLNDETSAICVKTERRVSSILGGNCHTPLAVFCKKIGTSELLLQARVSSPDGLIVINNSQNGTIKLADELADACAQDLLTKGATKILDGRN